VSFAERLHQEFGHAGTTDPNRTSSSRATAAPEAVMR
jgi:hypothetical protein